jgi:hypothetical protein
MTTGAMELGKVLTLDLDPSPYCARQARGRTSAKELGKVLTRESRLLHVVPSEQEANENRCSGTAKGAYPRELPPPYCARLTRSG